MFVNFTGRNRIPVYSEKKNILVRKQFGLDRFYFICNNTTIRKHHRDKWKNKNIHRWKGVQN